MQIEITTRHGELSEASQTKLVKKVEKLNRYFDRLTAIQVIVDLKNENSPEVEIIGSAEHRDRFVSHASANNLWAAVDNAEQKMEQQLRKHKEKLQSRNRNPDAKHMEAPDLGDPESDEE